MNDLRGPAAGCSTQTLQQAIGSGALPQPWTGHRGVVPVDDSFVAAVRAGAVVEFATSQAADAPRCRGQLTADQVRQVWWWNVFNLLGRNVLTRELLEDEVAPMVQRLVDPRLVDEGQLDAAGGRMSALLAKTRAAAELLAKVREGAVALTGREFGEFPDTPDGVKALRAVVREHLKALRGRWIPCPALGADVEIRKRSIGEMLHFSGNPKKLRLLFALEAIIRTGGRPVVEMNHKTAKKTATLNYFRLSSVVRLNGEPIKVTILVEQDTEGLLHYDLVLPSEKTKAAVDESSAASLPQSPPATKAGNRDEETVADPAESVKDDGEQVLDSVAAGAVLNLFIGNEASGVLDSARPLLDAVVSPLERVRIASVLSVKTLLYAKGGSVLERLRLARDIVDLLARLGAPSQEDGATTALRASLAESEDRAKAADAAGNINAAVLARSRAAAIRRVLDGTAEPHDVFMDREAGFGKLREALAGIDGMPAGRKLRTAQYVRSIATIMHTLANAEARANATTSGGVVGYSVPGVPADIVSKCDEILSIPGSAVGSEAFDPVIDDCQAAGQFGAGAAERLAAAAERAKNPPHLDSLTRQLSAKFDQVKQESEARRSALPRVFAEQGSAAYEAAMAEYRAWFDEVMDPVQNARLAELKAARESGAEAYAEVGRELINRVLAASTIAEDAAAAWARAQQITPQAVARLKKIGYPVEKVRADMADFYRFTGGRVPSVRIHSNGSRRANATDIENHGRVGTINLDSNFNRRVLWHELAHHIEADPVAKAAAGRFIRRRSADGKVYRLRSLTGNSFYRTDEAAYKDGFFDAYVGKTYRNGITEVFSMGIESFSDPEMLARRAAVDPGTLEFVAGFVRQPMDDLARAHMGLREILRGMNEDAEDEKGDYVDKRIAELADGVTLDESADATWLQDYLWSFRDGAAKQLGRFESGHYLLAAKVRNPDTWRKVKGLVIALPESESGRRGIQKAELPTTDVTIAKAAIGYWNRNGVLPTIKVLMDEGTLRKLERAAS